LQGKKAGTKLFQAVIEGKQRKRYACGIYLTALCFPDIATHSQDQDKEHNDAKDPDKNGIPKGYVKRNMTDRSVIFKQ